MQIKEAAKITKMEQLRTAVENEGIRDKLFALEDYSINLRTETFQLKHKNNLYEMEKIKSDADHEFFHDCIAEMKEILKLKEQLKNARQGVAQVYNIDEFAARDEIHYDQGVARVVTQRLPKGKLDLEFLLNQA